MSLEILIVDDSPTQALLLQSMLEQHGFQVLVAGSGQRALGLFAEKSPALVISDVLMPEMDGYDLCSRIKTDLSKDVPVILLTSLYDPIDLIRGLKCGADGFITKPCKESQLIGQINNLFANRTLHADGVPEVDLEVFLAEERHRITSNPLRLLTFLFNSYETAIQRNRELTKTRDELRHLSTHDALTGLYNRVYFDEELLRLGMGRDFPISIITADVDGLKIVNDTLGHQAGDLLLKTAAGLLESSFRAGDVVARVGGDEFVVLLPNADATLVGEIMERFRERLEEVNRAGGGGRVSISLGAATAYNREEIYAALKDSDRLMYEEKFERKRCPKE